VIGAERAARLFEMVDRLDASTKVSQLTELLRQR
jgi:hypothetical protein